MGQEKLPHCTSPRDLLHREIFLDTYFRAMTIKTDLEVRTKYQMWLLRQQMSFRNHTSL